jgi:hypothetical protein
MARGGHNRIDLTGQRFGRLVVLGYAETRRRKAYWQCQCDCGTVTSICGVSLTQGISNSCGCARNESTANRNLKHGFAKRGHKGRWYIIWNGMMARCYSKGHRDHRLYGARGIRVCNEWHDAAQFIAWCKAQEPVPRGMSLDRYPDQNGNYSPTNCRFATADQQSANRRPYSEWEKRT